MPRELCIFHANCQIDGLVRLLCLNNQFRQRYELRRYTNFLREPLPDEELTACSFFFYQHLGAKWEELASANLLARLAPGARAIKIPNMLFKGYWPFWTSRSPSEFGDSFIDELISMKLNKSEIMHICLHWDLEKKYDLRAMFEESLQTERKKEDGNIVQTVDWISENYRSRALFLTINHPGMELLARVAEAVFRTLELDIPSNLADILPNLYPEFCLPIHPQVARFHNLKFADENTRYNVFGKQKTYAEYASNYIDSQLLNITPLSAYLHIV
ncbi:MAG: hypothetical protein IJD04_02640 [Desulfovibrionaceae bacterium]|nr:hypothetical protein [Desulfovibrionaceae bacterium]